MIAEVSARGRTVHGRRYMNLTDGPRFATFWIDGSRVVAVSSDNPWLRTTPALETAAQALAEWAAQGCPK